MRKQIPILVIAASMLVTLLACFLWPRMSRRETAQSETGGASRVIIISIQNDGIEREFKRGFEAWHRAKFNAPCEVVWNDHGGTSLAVRFIKSEFTASPGGIGADLLWGGGIEPYLQLADLGLLEPVKLPQATLSALPASIEGIPLYDPKLQWFGTALSGFGILWNKPLLARLHLPREHHTARPRTSAIISAASTAETGARRTAMSR